MLIHLLNLDLLMDALGSSRGTSKAGTERDSEEEEDEAGKDNHNVSDAKWLSCDILELNSPPLWKG